MKDRSFSFFLGLSLLIHVLSLGILAAANLQNFFVKHKIIPSTIKVDMVGLPEKELPQKPIAAVVPPPSKEKTPKKNPPPEKKPVIQTQKPKKEKKSQTTEKNLQDISQENKEITKKDDLVKGNKVSQGADTEGDETQIQMEQLNSYIADIKTQIKLNWNLPKHLKIRYFYAQVEVKINNQGEFAEKRIVISSENELFDRLVLEALEKSSPVLPPPPSIKSLIGDGIIFGLNSFD